MGAQTTLNCVTFVFLAIPAVFLVLGWRNLRRARRNIEELMENDQLTHGVRQIHELDQRLSELAKATGPSEEILKAIANVHGEDVHRNLEIL